MAASTYSRRSFMTAGTATLAVGAFAAGTGQVAAAQTGSSARDNLAALDLEVMTVTDTSIAVSWTTYALGGGPAEADTELLLGPGDSRAPLRQVLFDETPVAMHHVVIDGLEPGRAYRFEARSGGVRAIGNHVVTNLPGSPERTGVVRTLVPPPGRKIRTIAVANDIHIGEEKSGLIVGDFPPGASQEPGLPPYADVMLSGMLAELGRTGITELFCNGDITAEARPAEVATARELLDGFGSKDQNWWATRGNHDRPHRGEEYASCAPYGNEHFDCWGQLFTPRQTMWSTDVGGLRVVGLDSTHVDSSGGLIDPAQFDELDRVLAENPDQPTLSLTHHPVTRDAQWSNFTGPPFVLDDADAMRLQGTLARTPGSFLHMSGHTHRTRRGPADIRPDDGRAPTEYLEAGVVVSYPGNYTLVTLYEGGYMVNLHRVASPLALRWIARSRHTYFGLVPEYLLGTLADRNHVVHRDFSGLR